MLKSFALLVAIIIALTMVWIKFYQPEEKIQIQPQSNANMDEFTQCLRGRGAVFYGSFRCSYCQSQKNIFGRSEGLLPYVECSMPDRSSAPICQEKKINSYPTWIFSDGSRLSGVIPLNILSQKTGCQLPN